MAGAGSEASDANAVMPQVILLIGGHVPDHYDVPSGVEEVVVPTESNALALVGKRTPVWNSLELQRHLAIITEMEARDLTPPPFEAWATVSISDTDSDSQDELDFDFPTLLDEAHRQEKELQRSVEPEVLPRLEPSASFLGRSLEEECRTVVEALKQYLPGMEEDANLYEEFRALRSSEVGSPLH